ncbi:MAG: DUF4124 domain-containing protein [Methylococcaceae bacterium]
MRIVFSKNNSILILMLLAVCSQAVFAKMYRWVDEQGNVFYSDQVPPKQSQYRRESLNNNARVIEVVEKQKTKAQQQLDKRLNTLRKQQDEIIKKQKAQDKVLLSTFRSLKDMALALEGKMSSLDGQRKSIRGNLKRIELQLQQQQKKAAQFERDGRIVPPFLLKDIVDSKEQIKLAKIEIAYQFEKKARIKEKFEADIDRFAYLTQSDKESKDLSRQTAEKKAATELGLYICESVQQCNKAWQSAKQFVNTYSTTALDIETAILIMSQTPYKETDFSLSVSKVNVGNNKQPQLFLDIRCHHSSIGKELCNGEKAAKIRSSFSGYIESDIAAEAL